LDNKENAFIIIDQSRDKGERRAKGKGHTQEIGDN
jgi:hypothetical protein